MGGTPPPRSATRIVPTSSHMSTPNAHYFPHCYFCAPQAATDLCRNRPPIQGFSTLAQLPPRPAIIPAATQQIAAGTSKSATISWIFGAAPWACSVILRCLCLSPVGRCSSKTYREFAREALLIRPFLGRLPELRGSNYLPFLGCVSGRHRRVEPCSAQPVRHILTGPELPLG